MKNTANTMTLKGLPPNATAKLSFDTKELVVGGGLAYERGMYKIELTDKTTGKPAGEMGGRHVHIFTRESDGSWKGWRLMENSPDPVVVAAPPPSGKAP